MSGLYGCTGKDEEDDILRVFSVKLNTNSQSCNVRCVAWNLQSAVNKVDDVISVLSDNKVDIACFSETWLASLSNTTTSIFKNADYNISHSFREKRGGGVAILWKNSLTKQVRNSSIIRSFDSFEYQNIIFQGKFKINVMSIYRLQEISFNQFLQELSYLLTEQDPRYPLVLTGDFNVHFEFSNSQNVKDLINLTSSFGLSQFVKGPTHKLGHTLDLLFANNMDFVINDIQPVSFDLSDHFPIFFDLPNISGPNVPIKKKITYRNLKSVNIPGFASDLGVSLTSSLGDNINNYSFSEMLDIYKDTVVREFNAVAPIKTRTLTTSVSPHWMDAEYKTNRATRRRLEREWKKSGLKSDKKLYVSQRDICVKLSQEKRSKYYHELILSKKGDQSALFDIISNILDKNKSRGVLPNHDTPIELANTFNEFYLNKVKQLRRNIPLPNHSTHCNVSSFNGSTLDCFRPTTVQELGKILQKSGIKTSFNDVLPAKILKQVIDTLLPHLCDLINKSLLTGSVEGIKESIVVPLLKKAGVDPEILKNYRPVADLEFLSKLSERVVAEQLDQHMNINNLHCKFEHGYKPYHSTETLLLRIVNDVLLSLDNNMAIILLLIDLSAAFDTVDIDLLLHIMESEIGIRGKALDWFASFLKDRNQRVLIGSSLSDSLKVEFGVPQGSVLGPKLFNIYIRSLFAIIEKSGFCSSGYADDNNAYQSFALHFQHEVINIQLPTLMVKIKEWMNSHFLKINPDKTEIIVFLPNNLRKEPLISGSFLEGDCIRFSNTVKNLGFKLDRFLTMDPQVDSTVSYCYKLISDVARIRHLLSKEDTVSLMHAIVSSRLDYCNVLLYGINKSVVHKLQKVQNAAARLIAKRKKRESVSDILIDLHWLPVEQRIIFKLLVLTFKIINGLAPECLSNLISVRSAEAFLLNNVYLDTNYGRRSFTYAAPRFWNALPLNIRSATSIDIFKSSTKHLLFNHFTAFKQTAFMYQ